MGLIGKAARWLLYGGSSRLRPEEKAVLDLVKTRLSAADQAAFEAQLQAVERIQRSNSDRMVTIHFAPGEDVPGLSNTRTELPIGKVKLEAAGSKLSATVFSHRGKLSSIEFTASPAPLRGQAIKASLVGGGVAVEPPL